MIIVPVGESSPGRIHRIYADAAARGDAAGAARAIDHALASGHPVETLVQRVLAPTQRELGRRWAAGEITIAQERVATAITEDALATLRRHALQQDTGGRPPRRVVMACAEGEWHALPAVMAGEVARSRDVEVVTVAGSCPADHLAALLGQLRPDALALSVTMPVNLLNAEKSIRAAHLVGVPVIVGGAAWGSGGRRAERLGADVRGLNAGDLGTALDRLASHRGSFAEPDVPREVADVELWCRSELRLDHEERFLLRSAAAAVACDDPSILDEARSWLHRPLPGGGVEPKKVRALLHGMARRLSGFAPLTAEMLSS